MGVDNVLHNYVEQLHVLDLPVHQVNFFGLDGGWWRGSFWDTFGGGGLCDFTGSFTNILTCRDLPGIGCQVANVEYRETVTRTDTSHRETYTGCKYNPLKTRVNQNNSDITTLNEEHKGTTLTHSHKCLLFTFDLDISCILPKAGQNFWTLGTSLIPL